jgi:hypothetical protein
VRYGYQPGKAYGRPAGEEVTYETLYRFMQAYWQALNGGLGKKRDRFLRPPPSSFSPGDSGYIPHESVGKGPYKHAIIKGGWSTRNMEKTVAEGKKYEGERPSMLREATNTEETVSAESVRDLLKERREFIMRNIAKLKNMAAQMHNYAGNAPPLKPQGTEWF